MTHTLTRQHQWLIAGILLVIMLLTRSHLIDHLQDASWAIFFILGFYVRSYLAFPLFWLAAFAIDMGVIQMTGTSNFCFTVSYPFLIPAYAAMWLAGHWLANHYQQNWQGLFNLVGAVLVGTIACELFSSGGFYWFSGQFAEPTVAAFLTREATFFPMYLQTTAMYIMIAAVIHLAISQASKWTSAAHQ